MVIVRLKISNEEICLPGIGYACTIIVFLLNCEYNIILTWTFYYLFSSFNSVLPWSEGNNEWNSEVCHKAWNTTVVPAVNTTSTAVASLVANVSKITTIVANGTNATSKEVCDPVTEFWEYVLLFFTSFLHKFRV